MLLSSPYTLRSRTAPDGAPAEPPDGAWIVRPGRPAAVPSDTRPRVLLAEDDAVTVRVLSHRLERDGLAVERVDDGLDALDRLAEARTAVALVAVALAGVDGFEVLRRVRAGDAGPPDLRLALMGWRGNDALLVRAFALDADDVIVRPFSLAEVSARVRRLARRATRP